MKQAALNKAQGEARGEHADADRAEAEAQQTQMETQQQAALGPIEAILGQIGPEPAIP